MKRQQRGQKRKAPVVKAVGNSIVKLFKQQTERNKAVKASLENDHGDDCVILYETTDANSSKYFSESKVRKVNSVASTTSVKDSDVSDNTNNCDNNNTETGKTASNAGASNRHDITAGCDVLPRDLDKQSPASVTRDQAALSSCESESTVPITATQDSYPEQPKDLEEISANVVDELGAKVIDDLNDDDMLDGEASAVDEYQVPFYLENFRIIVDDVLGNNFNNFLFTTDDVASTDRFKLLSENAQKLYVRLFQRQFRWLRMDKISYPRIAYDIKPILKELTAAGLLVDDNGLTDLSDALKTLPAPKVKSLALSLKVNNANKLSASELLQPIMKLSEQGGISKFFKNGPSQSKMILRRAKSFLGPCYRLDRDARDVFIRLVMLFSLHSINGDEDERGGAQMQLFQILREKIGLITFPNYKVVQTKCVFGKRQHFIRFRDAVFMENDTRSAFEANKFDEVLQYYREVDEVISKWDDAAEQTKHDLDLPPHLRIFSAGSVYTRVRSYGVEALQKVRDYESAVAELHSLIKQEMYHLDYRGRWYDRLALNLESHLKQPDKALDVIKDALADVHVKTGHRLALFQRAQRLCCSASHKRLHHRWPQFSIDVMCHVKDPPKVVIEFERTAAGVWVAQDGDDVTLIKRVEDVVLLHYSNNGFPQGIHGESSTFSFLFILLMWESIFGGEVADVFLNKYQPFPLDYYVGDFYSPRAESISNRLSELSAASASELAAMVDVAWNEYQGMQPLNWEHFNDLEHCKGLALCFGGEALSKIFHRFVMCMRHTRSGMPDLVVWNPASKKVKVVEVKGPNDRLSTKQILWLKYLVDIGVDAVVCHVTAIGNKRQKAKSST